MYAYHHFVNHTPERAGRVYTLWLQQDLFGHWTLVRVRGGQQREPVLHSQVVESREAGERLVAALVKLRLRHGYEEKAGDWNQRFMYAQCVISEPIV
jgi:hypothetical protein